MIRRATPPARAAAPPKKYHMLDSVKRPVNVSVAWPEFAVSRKRLGKAM